MNFQDLKTAREYFDKMVELCDAIENSGAWEAPNNSEIHLKDILRGDVATFILYLSASDGHISPEEVQAYRAITGYGGDDANSMIKYIKENNIYSMSYESEPPLIMKLLSDSERRAVYAGCDLKSSVLKVMSALYGVIGQIIISIDGGITYTEKRDLGIIMDTINGFANDHDIVGSNWSLLN